MRVLHLGKYYPPHPGGIEYFLGDLLPALSARGLGVAALVHDERLGGCGVRPGGESGPLVYRAPTFGQWLYAPISPAFPLWLQQVIETFQPNLLHLHLPNTSAFWALGLASARRLPWVIHWHADVVPSQLDRRLRWAYGIYRPFEQALLRQASRIIVTSPDYLAASRSLVPWRGRCRVIPLGLDPQRIPEPDADSRTLAEGLWESVCPHNAGGQRGWRVLAIGRLTYYKGHEVLIRAAAELPEAGILIVGGGALFTRLERLIQALGLGKQVRLLGYQPDPIVWALLASCDLLGLPSLERTEAFGLVQLEAMRFGKPVIASDILGSGVGWVIRQAGHGLTVPPNDPHALAQAIRLLAQDPLLARQLGQAGGQALTRQFAIVSVAAQIAALYRELLAAGDPTP